MTDPSNFHLPQTITNQSIFRIQAGVCRLFREFLEKRGFMEIHTPKIIGAATEGGANVFKLKYFDSKSFFFWNISE